MSTADDPAWAAFARLTELTALPSGGREAVAALPEDLCHALVFYLERQEGFAKQRAALKCNRNGSGSYISGATEAAVDAAGEASLALAPFACCSTRLNALSSSSLAASAIAPCFCCDVSPSSSL